MSFDEAVVEVRRSTMFTTHTRFPPVMTPFLFLLIDRYLHKFWAELGIDREQFLALGAHVSLGAEVSDMILALHLAGGAMASARCMGDTAPHVATSLAECLS
jgi:starch phosphorylase